MKWKNINLTWYAFYMDFNSNKLKHTNVLGDRFLLELHKKVYKKEIYDYSSLKEFTKRYLMYYFWSKSECEVGVCSLSTLYTENYSNDKFYKIDIWYQLEPNLDRIVDYINNEINMNYRRV